MPLKKREILKEVIFAIAFFLDLAPGYVPSEVESLPYDENYFNPRVTNPKPFSLILPPPNITGNLHLGHALTVTLEDVLVRW